MGVVSKCGPRTSVGAVLWILVSGSGGDQWMWSGGHQQMCFRRHKRVCMV